MTHSILNTTDETPGVIDKVDDNGELYILNYNYDNNKDKDDYMMKRIRGAVYDADTKKLVVSTSSFCDEETPEAFAEKYLSDESIASEKHLILKSYEGTLIRVFKHNGKTYIATHKKLDAYKSKWGSNYSFGQMFTYAINKKLLEDDVSFEDYIDSLDDKYVHTYLLRNSFENRLVSTAPSAIEDDCVYYAGSYPLGIIQYIPEFLPGNKYIPKPLYEGTLESVPYVVKDID
jgi:hypothetical protein